MSNQKIENNSSEAPLPTPSEAGETEELKNNNFTICPDCGSSIEILSINENRIEYRCLNEKNKHTEGTKFTKTNKEFFRYDIVFPKECQYGCSDKMPPYFHVKKQQIYMQNRH